MKKITEKQLFDIILQRLTLQSTRRVVESYGLPKYTISYFKSTEFYQLFNSWDHIKQTKFLQSLAGGYAKEVIKYLNK
jgi:hypothetical protein